MISILIVEDEKSISELIKMNLECAGYLCTQAFDGREACEILESQVFDLILLDVMLPYIDGFELMEYVKPTGMPVIFISAMSTLDSRMKGLTGGAEDYIVKPFEIVELLARINIVLRRYHKTESVISYKDIIIYVDENCVTKAGTEIVLTRLEYNLLLLFARNKGITLFRDRIYSEIWGVEYASESRTLDLHIQRLRKKLDLKDELKTIFRVGYKLETEGINEV